VGACPFDVRRKPGKSGRTSRACLLSFWAVREFLVRNLFLQAKRLTNITTGKFCDVWKRKPVDNFRKDGRARTVCRHKRLCQCGNSWLLKTSLRSPTLLTPLTWLLVICLLFPRMNSTLQGCRFQDVPEIREKSLTGLYAISKSQFQQCFQEWQ
jgi:hypothetical protein